MKITRILFAAAITFLSAARPTASPQPPVTPATLHRFAAPLRAGMAPMVEAPDGTLFGIAESGGVGEHGAVFKLTPDGSGGFTFGILYQFNGIDGEKPTGLTYSAFDDTLYGTTQRGGIQGPIYDGNGTVFSLTRAGDLTTLIDFNFDFSNPQPLQPSAPLLEASDGNFYGTGTASSTTPGSGAIFKMDREGAYTVLHVFSGTDGNSPASKLVEGSDGLLYGTTVFGGSNDAGTVFKIAKDGSGFDTLHSFTGDPGAVQPRGLVRDTAGGADVFYGLTGGGGTDGRGSVFRITPSGTFTPVASFPLDGGNALEGAYPNGALVKGPDGLFYGTTESGGPMGFASLGVVFSLDPASGTLAVVHDFNSDYATGIQTNAGLLLAADGTLLGTTTNGGTHRVGTIYRVDTAVAPAVVSKVLDIPALGPAFPSERLLRASDGHLYGTTPMGGAYNSGSIFRLAGGVVTTLHDFNFVDGHIPSGELMEGSDGNLYGTTTYGGNVQFPGDFAGGTVFRISKAGVFTMLHAFSDYAVEGAHPLAGLVEGPDGNFYGTTHQNGPSLAGTVFKMTPAGDITTLHSFSVWSATRGTLVIGEDGYFYGVTREGGSNPNGGTVYKIDSEGNFVLLHEFIDPADGAHPSALTLGTDGLIYGATEHGGTFGGTLFRITPSGSFTVLHRFDRNADGDGPVSAPIEAGDGNFYGSTWLGGRFATFVTGLGTLYRYGSGGFDLLHTFGSFTPASEGVPYAGLVQGSDNQLYGSTQAWGGVLFSYDAALTNKAPTARSQRVTVGPGETANVTIVASDPDGNPITFVVVDAPDNGTLTGSGPSFSYVPNPGFSGTDAFRVRVNDGTVSSPVAGVLITVGAANTAPVANDQSVMLDEDTSTSITLTGSDAEGNALSFTVVTPPAHGALSGTAPNLTYTPVPDYNGADSFTFRVNDGSLDSTVATVSIAVVPVNDAPVAHDVLSVLTVESLPTGIMLGATDPDGDALTFSIVTPPAHGALSGTGQTVTYTSNAGYSGPDSFTFKVNDGTADSNVATATISIRPANRHPVSNPGGPYVGDVGAPVTFDGTGSSDPDAPFGDAIAVYGWTIAGSIPLSGPTPTLSAAQVANLGAGTFTVVLTVSDGAALTNTTQTTLTIRTPSASFTASPNPGACGQGLTFDGSASANTRPGRTIVLYAWAFGDTATGSGPTVTHAYGAYGAYTASLTVTDDLGITATSSVSVDISQGNQPPTAVHGGPYFTYPNTPVELNGLASSDPNAGCGDSIVSAVWTINNGAIIWDGLHPTLTPVEVAVLGSGTFPVRLTLTDEFGASSTASTTLTIGGPVASFTAAPNPAACGQAISFNGSASSSTRPDRTLVSYQWNFGEGGTATGPMAGHGYASYGSYTATLTVMDDLGAAGSTSIAINVNQGNLPPIANSGGPYLTAASGSITLDGTGSTEPNAACGDSIVDYQWLVNGTFPLSGATPALGALVGTLGPGTFPVQLTVTDEFGAQSSASTSLTIQGTTIATATLLQITPNVVGALQPVTLTAQVNPTGGSGQPTGTVEFSSGTTVIGTAALLGGVATLNTNASSNGGTLSITARYLGAVPYAASVSAPQTLTVRPFVESTYTFVIPSTNPRAFGSPVTVSAVVYPLAGSTAPTGTVDFYEGTVVVASATLSSGVATATWTPAGAGLLAISARYLGNATFAPSSSHLALITVFTGPTPAATTTTLAAAPSPATFGQPVTFTATLSNNVPVGGVVVFIGDGVPFGYAVVANVGGVKRATLTTSGLPLGMRIVSASYIGAPGVSASNSALIAVVINP